MDPAAGRGPDAQPAPIAPILVVDDDAKIVTLVRTYLERDGFPVVEARDGLSALRAVEEHEPQLVVLDLMLPELDGLGVMRRRRPAPPRSHPPLHSRQPPLLPRLRDGAG